MRQTAAILLVLAMFLILAACGGNRTTKQPSKTIYTEQGVEIEQDAFPANTVLRVTSITAAADDAATAYLLHAVPQAEAYDIYELIAQKDGTAVQPDGTTTVIFPTPHDYDSARHTVCIYDVTADDPQPKSAVLEGNMVAVQLSHFGIYMVALLPKGENGVSTTAASATIVTGITISSITDD